MEGQTVFDQMEGIGVVHSKGYTVYSVFHPYFSFFGFGTPLSRFTFIPDAQTTLEILEKFESNTEEKGLPLFNPAALPSPFNSHLQYRAC